MYEDKKKRNEKTKKEYDMKKEGYEVSGAASGKLKMKNDENRDEREKKCDERVRREKFGERLEQINKKSEGGIRSKKRFEFTRKR